MANPITPFPKPLPKLKVITIDNAYTQLQRSDVQAFFIQLLALKAKGYAPPYYPPTYLTFDAADFVAWHHIFCFETPQGLEAISGFKQITLERCDYYGITPPYFGLLNAANASPHVRVLTEVFSRHRKVKKHLILSSGFTIREDLRGTETAKTIKELVAALMYQDSRALGEAPSIGAGVPRFKTEKLWEQTGFCRMQEQGKDLPPFPLITSNNEPILLMKADRFSDWAKQCHERHQHLIDSRLLISQVSETEKLAA